MRTGRPRTKPAEPYPLRHLMVKHNVVLRDIALAGCMSVSSASRMLLHRHWPSHVDVDRSRTAIEQLLRDRGMPDADIKTAWGSDLQAVPHAAPSNPTHLDSPNANPSAVDEVTFLELPEPEMLSPAAREHFRLPRNPFVDDIHGPSDVFLSKDQRYIRESMFYAAKHAGLLAVIGESGSGKSTLRRDLLDRLRRDNEAIVVIQPKTIDKSALTAAHICDAITADLSTEPVRVSLEAKGRQVERILSNSARTGNSHVLIIEEAHDLTNAALKFLKRFWELEDGFKRLIGVVMIGQPELAKKLDERTNYDLRELIRRTEIATLRPLNGDLENYLTLKFRRLGVALDDVFTADACDAIRARLIRRKQNSPDVDSQAYPLLVHIIVVKAMNAAAELGLPKVSGDLIRSV